MLILASASPRRRELLTQAGFSFGAVASGVPEERRAGEGAIAFASRLALEKAESVFARLRMEREPLGAACADGGALGTPGSLGACGDNGGPLIVVGADTVVVAASEVGNEILGKPADEADAVRMLRRLSGRTHQVVTGVCVVSEVATEVAAEVTYVTMLTPSEAEIAAYVATGEPMGKAGAYAIQGYAGRWIPRVQGCYFNVVGLPLALASAMIEAMWFRLERGGREVGAASAHVSNARHGAPGSSDVGGLVAGGDEDGAHDSVGDAAP